jgi:hypothetical protein
VATAMNEAAGRNSRRCQADAVVGLNDALA